MSLFDVEGEFERRIVEYDEDLFTFDEIDQNLKDIDPLPQLANQQQSDDEETIAKKRLRPIIYSSDEDDGVVLSQSKKRAFSVRNNRLLGRNNANALRQNAANRNENNVPAANRANGQLTKRIAEKYHVIRKIGFGNYGTVSLARLKETNKLAAIKQSSFKDSDKNREIYHREPKNLQKTNDCKFVMHILEYSSHSSLNGRYIDMCMIFEYCSHNLRDIVQNKDIKLEVTEVKTMLRQILFGIEFIHSINIVHRDIKSENILVTEGGIVKLADFGLSRETNDDPTQPYTPNLVTLWYRAPEILLGDPRYTKMVDMWSYGCVMAEFWARDAILKGKTEYNQLELISKLCGTINETSWPNVRTLHVFNKMEMPGPYDSRTKNYLNFYPMRNEHADGLFDRIMKLDPNQRCTAFDALSDDFFFLHPAPRRNVRELIEKIPTSPQAV